MIIIELKELRVEWFCCGRRVNCHVGTQHKHAGFAILSFPSATRLTPTLPPSPPPPTFLCLLGSSSSTADRDRHVDFHVVLRQKQELGGVAYRGLLRGQDVHLPRRNGCVRRANRCHCRGEFICSTSSQCLFDTVVFFFNPLDGWFPSVIVIYFVAFCFSPFL